MKTQFLLIPSILMLLAGCSNGPPWKPYVFLPAHLRNRAPTGFIHEDFFMPASLL